MSTSTSFDALKRVLRYAGAERRTVALASLCSVANKLFDIAPEILIGVAIDVVVQREQSFLAHIGVVDPTTQLLVLGVLTVLIWVGESAFEYAYLLLWRNFAQRLQHRLRVDAYTHIQQLPSAELESRSIGSLVTLLNDDVNQLERFFNGGANTLIQVAVTVIVIGGVFFVISPWLAMVAFIPIPVILWGAFFFQRRAAPRYGAVRERAGELSGRLAANLGGLTTVLAYVREQDEAERIAALSQRYVDANKAAIAVSSAFIPMIRMAILAGFVVTYVWGGILALRGELPVGWYGVLVFLTQRLLWPLTGLAETADLYERAMASARRVLGLLDLPPAKLSGSGHHADFQLGGALAFIDVGYRYRPDQAVLDSISFDVTPGQTVALVGPTGAGKSTVLKLLMRFLEPSSGSTLVDGVMLQDIDAATLRRQIGWVSQDVFLFDGSIADNIAYGRPDASREDIAAAAQRAEAHVFIRALPDGYDTRVGERGMLLSGGQRQRIALARALLKEPKLLLLDEATSAVDNETEAAIQRSLRSMAGERTTLMVAHRLSTIVHADLILVLDQGRIVERGRHEELVARGGLYAQLWAVQTGTA